MRLDPRRWFATLRARKRAVLWVMLPAFAMSAAAPTCAAMAAPPKETASVHEHGSAHATHHDAAQQAAETQPLFPACPHCPLASGDANVGHADCGIADAQSDAACAKSASKVPPPIMDSRLPVASAVPPLIATAQKHADPPPRTVPLTLRHCVLLI